MTDTAYLMLSGAVTAYRAPEFVAALAARYARVCCVPTPNAARVISPRDLARLPGCNVIESYFDARILPRPVPGPVFFAPCGFNSLNKLAAGIADNLALSITSEMIGFGQTVVVALSLNAPLLAHPAARRAIDTLRGWGVRVVEPVPGHDGPTLAPLDVVMAAM